jgi:hypothetical protein
MPWEVAVYIGEALGGGEAAAATAEAIGIGSAGEAAAGLTAGELAAADAAASGGLMGAEVLGSGVGSGVLTTGMTDAASKSLIQQLATYTGLSTSAIERLGGAAISSLASMYGAGKLGQASMDAANRLATANQSSTQLQSQMYQDQMARSQPFYQAGVNALKPYTTGIMGTEEDQKAGRYGNLVRPFSVNDWLANQDPARQLIMDEMGRATLHQAAAGTGGLSGVFSGNTAKALQDRAGQQTNKFYSDAYNRYVNNQATQRGALGNLAGFSAPANAAMTAAGTNYATNVNNLATNTAANYAGADLTSARARQSAYEGAGGAFVNAMSPNPVNAYLNKMMGGA